MERMTLSQFERLKQVPTTKLAIKGAAIMEAARAYVMDSWMVDELREQWDWATDSIRFPLDVQCPLDHKDFTDPRCAACEVATCPWNH